MTCIDPPELAISEGSESLPHSPRLLTQEGHQRRPVERDEACIHLDAHGHPGPYPCHRVNPHGGRFKRAHKEGFLHVSWVRIANDLVCLCECRRCACRAVELPVLPIEGVAYFVAPHVVTR